MKHNIVESEDLNPHITTTAFNCLRALLVVLEKDIECIDSDQYKLIEMMIDNNNVYIGAIYEVFLENENIEDLTHSLLVFLKKELHNEKVEEKLVGGVER